MDLGSKLQSDGHFLLAVIPDDYFILRELGLFPAAYESYIVGAT